MQRALAFSLLLAAGCTRSLDIPPDPGPPQPGTIQGRAVIALPGRTQRAPAAGAVVRVTASGVATTADSNGQFRLEGLTQPVSELLFRYDADGDGHYERQKQLALEALAAGPGRQVNLGDVLLVENARMTGKVLRSDVMGPSGHAGSLVFVPEGPFTAQTSDDGTFVLDELPEGTFGIAFFRPGYLPDGVAEVTVTGGSELTLKDVHLAPDPMMPVPSGIVGRVLLSPSQTDNSGVQVSAVAPGGMPQTATSASDGAFHLTGLAPGVYQVTLSRDGYATAVVPNVLVLSGSETNLSDITLPLGPGVFEDAGTGGGSGAGGGTGTGGGGGGGGGGTTPPNAPVARVNAGSAVAAGQTHVHLDGTASSAADGGALIFHWVEDTADGFPVVLSINHSLLGATPLFDAPPEPTVLHFTLTVTDQQGVTSPPASTQVEVLMPPVITVTPLSLSLPYRGVGTLDASGSMDRTGSPLTFKWSVEDGGMVQLSATTGPSITVTAPATTGGSKVGLVVSNGLLSAATTIDVVYGDTIEGAMITTSADEVVGLGQGVVLTAMATSVVPGEGFSFQWTQTAGPQQTLTKSSTGSMTTASFSAPSTETTLAFDVVAQGDMGSTATATVHVFVVDGSAPTLVASDPPNVAMAPGSPYLLWARFSEALDPMSIDSSTVRVSDGTADVTSDLRWDSATNTLTVSPRVPLTTGKMYTLVLGALTDATTKHNMFAGKMLPFTARAPQLTRWSTPTSSVEMRPAVAANSTGAYVVSRMPQGTCPGSYSMVWVGKASATGATVDQVMFGAACATPVLVPQRRMAAVGETLYVLLSGNCYNCAAATLVQWSGGTWTGASNNFSYSNLFTDGTTLATTFENYGIHWDTFTATGVTDLTVDNTTPGYTNSLEAYTLALTSGRRLAVGLSNGPRQMRAFESVNAGAFTQLGAMTSPTSLVMPRAAYAGAHPLICFTHIVSTLQQLSCAMWDGAAWVLTSNLGGGSVDYGFDVATRGDTAWIAYSAAGQVYVKQLDTTTNTVTPVLSVGGGASWNNSPTCSASWPEMHARPDALYVSWQENCAGTWQSFLQRVQ